MIIAQITDTHILPKGKEWLDQPETDTAGRLRHVVEHINRLMPRPDVLLLTGDTVEIGCKDAYQHLKEILKPLSMPVYVIPGNHDDREEMRAAFSDTSYIPQEGFLQYVIDDFPVRLIALDTNVPNEDYGRLCKERLHWLEEKLVNLPPKPTLLFMHHYPMKVGQKCFDKMVFHMEGEFEKLIESFPHILGIVAGHYHKMCTSLFGGKICFVAPSAAPTHYFAKDEDNYFSAIDLVYPSFALHRWMGKARMVSEGVQAVTSNNRLDRFKKTSTDLAS
ncbi:MAG: phosphodiesterase [Proteobacteria bacterium]|nr:phosphodiesterase [Pseudomonadota bacterium]